MSSDGRISVRYIYLIDHFLDQRIIDLCMDQFIDELIYCGIKLAQFIFDIF